MMTTSTVTLAAGAPHAEIVLRNHISTLREWAEIAEAVASRVYSEHQSFERYGLKRAALSPRSDLSTMRVTARARAAYRAFLDRMLDKETHDVLQVMEDYLKSEADLV